MTETILIAGCGDLGTRLGRRLAEAGHAVWGLRRSPDKLPADVDGFHGLAADLFDADALAESLRDAPFAAVDRVVYATAASGFEDDAYRRAYVEGVRNLLRALDAAGLRPKRWVHVGSSSVYAQENGEWVDEDSPTEPEHFGGRRLLEGEALLDEATVAGQPLETVVLRLTGIYGPGRTRLIDSVRSGRARCYDPPVYSNRIHVDDAAAALEHLLFLAPVDDLYLGVDHEPAPDGEVKRWLAEQLGVADPPTAEPSPGSRAMRSNKRCRNARLVASGFRFRYPNYRVGYGELLDG